MHGPAEVKDTATPFSNLNIMEATDGQILQVQERAYTACLPPEF